MPERYLGLTKKISKSQINLKRYFQFYTDHICQFLFNYHLENGQKIEVKFERNNFPHLLGLHKFKRISAIDKAEAILEKILSEEITASKLKESENRLFDSPMISDRLMFFPTLMTVLENSDFILKFDPFKCIPTKLDVDFLINSHKIRVVVYLGIREIRKHENKIICCPVSFIVDRSNSFNKENQEHNGVIKIEKIEKFKNNRMSEIK